MAKIIIPTPLRKFTDDASTFETKGVSVKDGLVELSQTYPALKEHILDEEGSIRKFLKIYLEDEDIDALEGENTKVESNATISIIPAIAGGY